MSQTISEFLCGHLVDVNAIGDPKKEWLTYGALRDLSQKVNIA